MNEENHTIIELLKQLIESETKYTYFLLAAAASGIAFAITRTTGMALEWSMIPLGLAAISWAGSFFAGCRNRQYFLSILYSNYALLEVQYGRDPKCLTNSQLIQLASKGITEAIKDKTKKENRWGNWQFRLLILGAILFIGWHILLMNNNSRSSTPPEMNGNPASVRKHSE